MQAVQLLVLCTLSCVGALDVFIEGPTLLLDCRSHGGSHMIESTTSHGSPHMVESTTSGITVAAVNPYEFYEAAQWGDLSVINTAISQLSTSGLDLNWRNPNLINEDTALHIAASYDQSDVVAALLDAGAEPNVLTREDETPIYMATYHNSISVLRVLLDPKYQVDVNLQDIRGWAPVWVAAWRGFTDSLELLLANAGDPNKLANDGTSPLMVASERGHVEAVRMLIHSGAHVNYVRPKDGWTALHATWDNRLDVARLLLENGADKNKQDNLGRTPAQFARVNYRPSLEQLIDNY